MFFLKELVQVVTLHPSYFTPALKDYLHTRLRDTVEGSCSGKLGYIISVLSIDDIGRGKVIEGGAEFRISYKAIVYRPFRGEVVDGVVASVNKMGVFADVGPLQCFISTHASHTRTASGNMRPELILPSLTSSQLIPSDFAFDPNANPPCLTSAEENLTIEKGAHIRLKIVGTRVDATEIFAIGTIKEDYLGVV
ncbi:BZ3500_MvSof-1268-A1-R1_Chr4-3g07349 [Microbotryum saponariae]|uniref:BZ3500_MvSof-1268-A1-R1_Chr4-3g07349 protein n=1 Tax=Microbotryum saponariae TaxID=289078 RepID=A0A2X0NGW4_9BASI|nr:BZ3500_MvSof-1268-A1-R1_Chr4-3g07349 [Microbotryum saponariae]SDA07012.1 BZ3501_MvSof-1269-A2-R1_Chr4-2g07058 [Microbotryum saponariae]